MTRRPTLDTGANSINAVLLDIREELESQLADTLLGPPGQVDIVWRDSVDSRGCDCANGRAYIRWASSARETDLNASVCGYSPNLHQLEIAVVRCISEPVRSMPAREFYTEQTAALHSDRCAIQRTIRTLAQSLSQRTPARGQLWIQASQPWGPQAGCVGNLATVHYRVR